MAEVFLAMEETTTVKTAVKDYASGKIYIKKSSAGRVVNNGEKKTTAVKGNI